MKKRWIAVILVMAMMMVGVGCAKGGEQTAADGEEAAETGEEQPEEPEVEPWTEEDEQELYNLYVSINNEMLGRLADSLGKYFDYVEYQEEYSLLDDDYFCYSISSGFFEDLDRAAELLERKEEKSELDEAYLALAPSVRELGEALNEVYEYTDEDSFLEDDYAKGKELHARVWKSCNEYETLGTDFVNKINELASGKRQEDLAQMQEEGYVVTYAIVSMLTTAQEIQTAIYDQGIEDDTMILQLDTEAIQPLYERYQEEVAAVLAYLKDEEALGAEGYPTMSAYYLTFEDAMENSLEELNEIFKNVAEQKQPASHGMANAFIVDGTILGYNSKVSAMIDEYNRLIGQ